MRLLIGAACAAAILSCASAVAEPPTFEVNGLPITPHQVALLGLPNVEEMAPGPSLVVEGMPASPHQLAVLAPRHGPVQRVTSARQVGLVPVTIVVPLDHAVGAPQTGEH